MKALFQVARERLQSDRPEAICTAAHFHAELRDEGLVGSAELFIETGQDSPQLMPLSPWNFSIASANWKSQPTHSAQLGSWTVDNDQIPLGVLVRKGGCLLVNWSLTAEVVQQNQLDFVLQSPVSAAKKLFLVVPADSTVDVSHGLIAEVQSISDAKKRLEIELHPSKAHRLRIRQPVRSARTDKKPRLSQNDSHEIGLSGLTTSTRFRLESVDSSLETFRAIVPKGVHLLSAELNGTSTDWELQPESPGKLAVVVPLVASDQPLNIELRSYSPFEINQPWALPRFRPLNVQWTEGSTTIGVDSSLEVQSLSPQSSSLHHSLGIGKNDGEVFRFHDWSRASSIKIELARRTPRMEVKCVTTMDWDADELTAQLKVFLSSENSKVYRSEVVIQPEWKIEKVTCTPKAVLQDWNVYEDKGQRILRLHFNEPIVSGSPIQLQILARGPSNLIRPHTRVKNLRVLDFRNTTVLEDLLYLSNRQSQSKSLTLEGGASQLPVESIPPELAKLLPKRREAVLVDLANVPEETFLHLQSEPPTYEANVHIHQNLLPTTINYNYEVRCTPLSGMISEISIVCDSPLPADLLWSIAGAEGLITSETVTTSTKTNSPRTTYRLRLPAALKRPFVLKTDYTVARQDSIACNLIQIPSAASWRGIVSIHGAQSDLRILDDDWDRAISFHEHPTRSHILPVLACYRFDAEDVRSNAPLVILTNTTQQPSLPKLNDAVCQVAHYRTWHSIDGKIVYHANYHLENVGSSQANLLLPSGAKLIEASMDGGYLAPEEILLDQQLCTFLLPKLQGEHVFSLRYTMQDEGLGLSAAVTPEFPKSSFPIMQSRWTLSLPKAYLLESEYFQSLRQNSSLWHRLFHPISRNSSGGLWNPLSSTHLGEDLVGRQSSHQFRGANNPSGAAIESQATSAIALETNVESESKSERIGQNTDSSFLPSYRAHNLEFVRNPPLVRIYNKYAKEAHRKLAFALALLSGIAVFSRKPKGVIYACAASFILCLLAPLPWLSFAQAVFLGLLTSLVLQLLYKSWQGALHSSSPPRNSSPSTIFLLFVLSIVGLFATSCMAEESVVGRIRVNDSSETPLILIPVDEKGIVVGTERFIQEDLLVDLQSIEANRDQVHARYVLTRQVLRGALRREASDQKDMGTTRNPPRVWKLLIFVESYQGGANLDLPLHRDEAHWLDETVRIDGLPTKCFWDTRGTSCRLKLAAPGKHQIELSFLPKIQSDFEKRTLQMHLPPCPRTEVDLAADRKLADVDVVGTAPKFDEKAGRWKALVPPGQELRIHWLSKDVSTQQEWPGTVDQYSWLQVDPATARFQVQFHLQSESGPPPTLRFSKPRHLKLVSPESGSGISRVSEITPDTFLLEFENRPREDHRINLSFELQRSLSLGQIALPEVRCLDMIPNKHLFAVSVDSHLSYDEVVDEQMRSYSPEEFASAWGADVHPPLYAYLLDKEIPLWTLNVWPTPKTYSVQQAARVLLGQRESTIRFEAEIDNIRGDISFHRLTIDKGIEISSIQLSTPTSPDEIPIRWSRVNEEELVVFLGQPLGKKHILTIQGKSYPDSSGIQALPSVNLLGTERKSIRMDLFRKKDARVTWTEPKNKPVELTQQSLLPNTSDVFVGQYAWKPLEKQRYSSLHIQKNQLQFGASTCITMSKQADERWEASLSARIHVKNGLLDQVELTAPDSFQGPYRLLPEDARLVVKPNKSHATETISVVFPQPIQEGEKVDLRITGVLNLGTSQQLVAPPLHLLGANTTKRFLKLPTSDGKNSISWNRMFGLRKQSLPSEVQELIGSHVGHLSYRIQQQSFVAHQRLQKGTLRKTGLRYCVIDGLLDSQNMLSATAHFVLMPSRARYCELKLPPHSELIDLTVGNQHVVSEITPQGLWKIPLGPSYLPRKIRISYYNMLEPSQLGSKLMLWPPKIIVGGQALPLDKAYWKLRFAEQSHSYRAMEALEIPLQQLAQQLVRSDLKTMEDTVPHLSELSLQEARSWLTHWTNSIRTAEHILSQPSDKTTTRQAPDPTSYLATVQFMNETLSELSERFGTYPWEESTSQPDGGALPRLHHSSPNLTFDETDALCFLAKEAHLDLETRKMGPSNYWNWLLSGLVLFGLAVASRVSEGWDIVGNRILMYPKFLSMTLGIVCWLCFYPSWIGLVFVAFAAIASLRDLCWSYLLRRRGTASTQYPVRVS